MRDTPHAAALKAVLSRWPSARTKGFRKALIAAIDEWDEDDHEHLSRHLDVRPDAFVIDAEREVIAIFEVEDTSHLTHRKLMDICDLGLLITGTDWDMLLVKVDRYGIESPVDWLAIWHAAATAPAGNALSSRSKLLNY